ncbi:MAG: glycosyltransferase [Candidatus Hodarchaeota archaeon]
MAKNYERYITAYYHNDIITALQRNHECFVYGEGYPSYCKTDTIKDVIAKSPFTPGELDLVVVGTSWEVQDPKIPESDPHPKISLKKVKVPKIFFLNKEYKKLSQKLEYAKNNSFDLICTAHPKFQDWAKETGLKFIYVPFAIDPNRFRFTDDENKRIYDFGFTGNLHRNYTNTRYAIKCKLFENPNLKANFGISIFLRRNPIKEKYKRLKIYWAEWGARSIWGKSMVPTGEKYVSFLRKFQIFLSTPSAMGLVGNRYFEIMASKSLLFCPESESYKQLFESGKHFIPFKVDLSDFDDNLFYYIRNKEKRRIITENAYVHVINNHTYDKRIEFVLSKLNEREAEK